MTVKNTIKDVVEEQVQEIVDAKKTLADFNATFVNKTEDIEEAKNIDLFRSKIKGMISYYSIERNIGKFAVKNEMRPVIVDMEDKHYKAWREMRDKEIEECEKKKENRRRGWLIGVSWRCGQHDALLHPAGSAAAAEATAAAAASVRTAVPACHRSCCGGMQPQQQQQRRRAAARELARCADMARPAAAWLRDGEWHGDHLLLLYPVPLGHSRGMIQPHISGTPFRDDT